MVCDQTSQQVPLVVLVYRGETYWICPQHLPVLIHEPAKLAGKMPGAENLKGSGHEH
jgi:hypothetical protein